MEILKIPSKVLAVTYRAVRSVLWRGWKITYGILCIPKKLLDLAIRRFRNNPQPNIPPIINHATQIHPTNPDQHVEPPTPKVKPLTPTQPGQEGFVYNQGSSGSFENVQQPGLTSSSSEIFESVEITKQEAAPGLIVNQSNNKGLFAYIFSWRS